MLSDERYQEIEPGQIRVLSPAKINLFLHVIGKRSDGYHDLCSLMCQIAFYDEITIRLGGQSVSIQCSHPEVPADSTNLAHRAASGFFRTMNLRQGADIYLKKNIPVGGGLGGGSSNAASTLMGLNRFFGNPLTKERLMQIGLSLGADVPFFIFGRPAIARGVGEQLEAYNQLKNWHVIVVTPYIRVSTAEVFKNLNLALTKCKKKTNSTSFTNWIFDAERDTCNDLESYTASKYPIIEGLKEKLIKHGAEGALMSGSGSSVFGLFTTEDAARHAHERLISEGQGDVYLTHLLI